MSDSPIQAFTTYLEDFKTKVNHIFHSRDDLDRLSSQRGLPPYILREIMSTNPLSVGIPEHYGGRGGHIKECLAVMEVASYESLAFSLMLAINLALFIQPVSKYADDRVKASVFSGIINQKRMGGLMITEPEFGNDALHMRTQYTKNGEFYEIKGTKHWAGLTGWADYWLLTARQNFGTDNPAKDIDFFVFDANAPGQPIIVEEYFNNLGLYMIPYGRNRIDVKVPSINKLQPQTSGLKMMLDILHHSRMMIPGTGIGFFKRILDESLNHTHNRKFSGKTIINFDQVQQRLSRIQASYTICSAMCLFSSNNAGTARDLTAHSLEPNIIKTLISDLMQEAAQSYLQLSGAKGYKIDNLAGRSIVDSRPFQIFEGSNDILYFQITEAVIKMMKQSKINNLYQFFKSYPLSISAAEIVKNLTNFELTYSLTQRKEVELGRAIARIISMGIVIDYGKTGFRSDLIEGAVTMLKQDVSELINVYAFDNKTKVIEDYKENSSWFDLMS